MKRYLIYGLFLLLPVKAIAQDVVVQVDYPSVVQNGQQFTIAYSVNAGGGNFAVPSFQGFYKLMGPSTSYELKLTVYQWQVVVTDNVQLFICSPGP